MVRFLSITQVTCLYVHSPASEATFWVSFWFEWNRSRRNMKDHDQLLARVTPHSIYQPNKVVQMSDCQG